MKTVEAIFQNELKEVGEKLLNINWKDPEVYAEWLAQTYFFVCHSTRIIATAGVKFPIQRNELHNRFLHHACEEKNHEIIAVKDLKHLGKSIDDYSPLPSTQAFYQTQYFWIEQVDPISVYGYFILLEALAIQAGPEILKILKPVFPEKSLNFLKIHVEEDDDHIDAHNEVLGKLSEQDKKFIVENLKVSAHLYQRILEGVEAQAAARKMKKAG